MSIACSAFCLLVECVYCLFSVSVACGMCPLLVRRFARLWNLFIACFVFLLLVECVHCLLGVLIACGMCLLLV